MKSRFAAPFLMALVLAQLACGGETAPTAPESLVEPQAVVDSGGVDAESVRVAGSVVGARLARTPVGVAGRARGQWELEIEAAEPGRPTGTLSLRARIAGGGALVLRGRIHRAALRGANQMRFAGAVRVSYGGSNFVARAQGVAQRTGSLNLTLTFAGGETGKIFGTVEEFEIAR